MSVTRTRIARLTAASAVVVSLGALTAGPAAAQTGIDTGARAASIDWVAAEDPSSVTFSSYDATSTTAVTFAAGEDAVTGGGNPFPHAIDTKAAEDPSSVTFSSDDDATPNGSIQAI